MINKHKYYMKPSTPHFKKVNVGLVLTCLNMSCNFQIFFFYLKLKSDKLQEKNHT